MPGSKCSLVGVGCQPWFLPFLKGKLTRGLCGIRFSVAGPQTLSRGRVGKLCTIYLSVQGAAPGHHNLPAVSVMCKIYGGPAESLHKRAIFF